MYRRISSTPYFIGNSISIPKSTLNIAKLSENIQSTRVSRKWKVVQSCCVYRLFYLKIMADENDIIGSASEFIKGKINQNIFTISRGDWSLMVEFSRELWLSIFNMSRQGYLSKVWLISLLFIFQTDCISQLWGQNQSLQRTHIISV